MGDLMARASHVEPPHALQQFDPAMMFNKTMGELRDKIGRGYQMTPEEYAWLCNLKGDFEEIIKECREKNKVDYKKETHQLLVQMEDKHSQLVQLIETVVSKNPA